MLRTRLFLNLLPFVVMLLGTGVYAILLFSRLAGTVDAAVVGHYRSVVAAQQMTLALAGIDREAWSGTAFAIMESRALAQHQQWFEQNLALRLTNSSLPGEKALDRQLTADYEHLSRALAALGSTPDATSRRPFYESQIVPDLLKVRATLTEILDRNQQAILGTNQEVKQLTRSVTRLMLIGIAVAFLISAYAYYQLSRSILRPVQSLTNASRQLGEGKLDQPVPVASRDELGELAGAFNNMAAQLQEYRQSTSAEIVRLHRTMETTLASFPDPIFVLNKEGRIELGNPAAAELASALGMSGQLPGRLQATAQKTLASGEQFLPHSFDEVVSYRVNGTEKFFLPRILAMRDKQDALFGVAVVLYDVTRFRLLDAAKTDLVATVSHELKTPLTSVRMALHILLEQTVGALTPKQDELLQAARNDSERLLRILNDLLDLARLEEGNAELHREKVAPAELFQSVMAEVADKFTLSGLKVTCSLDPELPPVHVDRQRISHVFTNLLNNAIKHSPAGGEISLRAARAPDNTVQFSVADQGPGIQEKYHSRIFDRFFRVPGQTRTGAGLGLSIAREITLAHGGRISVKSTLGHGATFNVFLKAADGAG